MSKVRLAGFAGRRRFEYENAPALGTGAMKGMNLLSAEAGSQVIPSACM